VEFAKIVFHLNTIQLGPVGEEFLNIISQWTISAYGIFLILRDKVDKRTKISGMQYGNIHKRIQRLQTLGLIEVEGKYSRNEKKYKITSYGLFKLMLDYGLAHYALLQNKDDIILQTLLFQFFEVETIKKFITIPRVYAICDYLRNISNAIVKKLEELRKLDIIHGPQVVSEIEDLILREIEQFVFLIIVHWKASPINYWNKTLLNPYKNKKLWFTRSSFDLEEDENGPNYSELFPKPALMKDKKFMKVLKEIKDNFEEGCKDYLFSLRILDKS
jgi:hypothetical protein